MKKITLLIADDHQLVRQAIDAILSADPRFEVIALCKDGEEAVKMAGSMKPDVVLIDINMPVLDGYRATRQIRKCSPASRIVCVSMHTDPSTTNRMLEAGA